VRIRRGPATVIGERPSHATAIGWKARRAAIREPGDSRHRVLLARGGAPRRELTPDDAATLIQRPRTEPVLAAKVDPLARIDPNRMTRG
jgi:hypothetical protein